MSAVRPARLQLPPPNNDIDVVLDLNGYGLRVNGEPYAPDGGKGVAGNPKVSILLTDDGVLEYTNASKVTGTPVLYRRVLFSPYQKGSWQSLFLPFDGNTIPSVQFGVIDGVDLKDTEATLNINYHTGALTAFNYYLVRANDNFELHPTGSTLYPYQAPVTSNISTSGYTVSGSLKNTDHEATGSSTFWVLTNDGNFWYSAPDNHQRPYRWVIFDRGAAPSPQSFVLHLNEGDSDFNAIAPLTTAPDSTPSDVYTISGLRVRDASRLPAGLYITSGHKVLGK